MATATPFLAIVTFSANTSQIASRNGDSVYGLPPTAQFKTVGETSFMPSPQGEGGTHRKVKNCARQ